MCPAPRITGVCLKSCHCLLEFCLSSVSGVACLCCWILRLLPLPTLTVISHLISLDVAGIMSPFIHAFMCPRLIDLAGFRVWGFRVWGFRELACGGVGSPEGHRAVHGGRQEAGPLTQRCPRLLTQRGRRLPSHGVHPILVADEQGFQHRCEGLPSSRKARLGRIPAIHACYPFINSREN